VDTSSDFAWLVEHDQELSEKYAGKWVAIWHEKVIAVGDDAVEVSQRADLIAPRGEYVLRAVDADVDVIYGGLFLG